MCNVECIIHYALCIIWSAKYSLFWLHLLLLLMLTVCFPDRSLLLGVLMVSKKVAQPECQTGRQARVPGPRELRQMSDFRLFFEIWENWGFWVQNESIYHEPSATPIGVCGFDISVTQCMFSFDVCCFSSRCFTLLYVALRFMTLVYFVVFSRFCSKFAGPWARAC